MLAKRSLEQGALLFHEVLQVVRFLDSLLDRPCLSIELLGLRLLVALLLFLQLSAHLIHPLLLHHFHAQIVALGLVRLLLEEALTPQVDSESYDAQEDDHDPAVTQQWWCDGDIENSLVLTHCSILVEHAYMQHIVAMMERHVGDVRIVLLGGNPLIAESLKLVDEARVVMYLTLVGGQLDGELTLVMAEHKFMAYIKILFKNDTTIVLLAYTHLLSEQLESTEDRSLVIIGTGDELGIDDVDAIHTTNKNQSVGGDTYRALVVRALLESVLAAEAAHIEAPLAISILLRNNIRHSMFGDDPHGVELVLDDAHNT